MFILFMKIVPYPIRIINNYRLSISLNCALDSLPVESTLLPIDLVFRLICSTQLKSRSDRQIPFPFPFVMPEVDRCVWPVDFVAKNCGKKRDGRWWWRRRRRALHVGLKVLQCVTGSDGRVVPVSVSDPQTYCTCSLSSCLFRVLRFCTRSAAELIMSLAAQLVADDNKDMPQVGQRERERDSLDGATIAEQCL